MLPEGAGMLLYHLATKLKPQIHHHMPLIVKYIVTKKLDNTLRVDKAIEFALTHISDININEFERFCGVGVVVTPEEIEKAVEKIILENKSELLEKRYKFNSGLLMQKVRSALPWADGKAVKNEVDVQVLDLLGPKTEADLLPAPKTEKKVSKGEKTASKPKEAKSSVATNENEGLSILDVMKKVNFHAPGENYKTDGYVVTENTERLLREHLKVTGGKVSTCLNL